MYDEYIEYHPLVKLDFDLDLIRKELKASKWEPDIYDPYYEIKAVYIGSALNCPSGKYYTPFACSNVELHVNCRGRGCRACGYLGSREALLDAVWYELLEKALESIGAFLQHGEGDPLDLFAVISRERRQCG